jgi:hypothetical protein
VTSNACVDDGRRAGHHRRDRAVTMPPVMGMFAGPSAPQQTYETATHLGLDLLPLGQNYLPATTSWATMWAPFYPSVVAAHQKAVLTVPMLIGSDWDPGRGATGQSTSPQAPSDHTGSGNAPTTMTLAAVAAGTWDYQFGHVFDTIAAARPDAIIRLGWESYGDWYQWGGASNISNYAAAWQHLVTLARGVSSAFSFDWNGGANKGSYTAAAAYPGDAYVDYISADVYDIYSPGGAAGWGTPTSGGALSFIWPGYTLAQAHEKPFCLSEYGLWPPFLTNGAIGYGDDPAWIEAAFEWLTTAPGIGYGLFFDGPALSQTVTNVTYSGSTVTVTLSASVDSRIAAEDTIHMSSFMSTGTLAAVADSNYFEVTGIAGNQLSYSVASTPTGAYTSGGTLTVSQLAQYPNATAALASLLAPLAQDHLT